MKTRDQARQEFIAAHGWEDATLTPLQGDASFRHYLRLQRHGDSRLLMDAPPTKPEEDVRPFVKIANHLVSLGLSAPRIEAVDALQGFVLLEDFGDTTFNRLLREGHDEHALYASAIDALIALHKDPRADNIDLGYYREKLISDAVIFLDWYQPDIAGRSVDETARQTFVSAWEEIIRHAPPPRNSFMHRDFHIDNLMLLPRPGFAACGILDFQDGAIAPTAYDVVSLLEDARRDISDELTAAMLARYDAAIQIDESFAAWYQIMGVQRHCRVMGVFARLSKRDSKHHYRAHLPRLVRLLKRGLEHAPLSPLKQWAEDYFPELYS